MSNKNLFSLWDEESDKIWLELKEQDDREKHHLRAAAVTLAQSKGVVVDDIERAALDDIITMEKLMELIVVLSFAGNQDEARAEWTQYFRGWFHQNDYRLRLEIKKFIKQRTERLQREAAAAAKPPQEPRPETREDPEDEP